MSLIALALAALLLAAAHAQDATLSVAGDTPLHTVSDRYVCFNIGARGRSHPALPQPAVNPLVDTGSL